MAVVAVAVLIAANGVFVAFEFALVSVRRPAVAELVAQGDRRARMVDRELRELSFALSVAQFGITATSLVVGYLADAAIGRTAIQPMLAWLGLPPQASLGVAAAAALLLSTVVQVVLGELVPKNVALTHPLAVARNLAPFTRLFGRLLRPLIRLFDVAATSVARRAFRVEPTDALDTVSSIDDLARIIAASGAEGSLSDEQAVLLERAVELGEVRVGEIMVPGPDVAWIAADADLDELRAAARRTGHSRFPVRGQSDDDVLGSVHIKDLLGVPSSAYRTTTVASRLQPVLTTPEHAPVRHLLGELRRARKTFAIVVDEHGATAGIVTIEDVVEQLVGQIVDEFDRDEPRVRRAGTRRYLVDGSARVDQLADEIGLNLPDGAYATIAGYVLERLGHIPAPGEAVRHDGWWIEVARADPTRIVEFVIQAPEDVP